MAPTLEMGCDIHRGPNGEPRSTRVPPANSQLPFTVVTQQSLDLSRRQALKVGAGVVALVVGGGAAWSQFGPNDSPASNGDPAPSKTPTLETIPSLSASQIDALAELDKSAIAELDPAIAVIGRRYLADHPEEADPTLLLSLLPDPAGNPITAASTAVDHDFRSGNTVSVAGWVLAVSEARAAAVVALVCSSTGQC